MYKYDINIGYPVNIMEHVCRDDVECMMSTLWSTRLYVEILTWDIMLILLRFLCRDINIGYHVKMIESVCRDDVECMTRAAQYHHYVGVCRITRQYRHYTYTPQHQHYVESYHCTISALCGVYFAYATAVQKINDAVGMYICIHTYTHAYIHAGAG